MTATAGNMGQAIAYLVKHHAAEVWGGGDHPQPPLLPAPEWRCVCLVPVGSSAAKLESLRRLGAEVTVVTRECWWQVISTRDCSQTPLGADADYRAGALPFVHPVCEDAVLAGNATLGASIAAQLPDADLVLVPFGGGGLSLGVAA
ncbi:MAG: pyridoxal-phosphate dependent enzyme, partial [archaeon]|nr:pyridoxal-phosphate dependent enzyme [archaeon]